MRKICRVTHKPFDVCEEEQTLLRNLSKAHPLLPEDLPLPDTAPIEFLRQMACWGNLLNIYKSKSSFSGNAQLTRYNPELGFKICTPDEFWSLKIDNTEFGRPYDFNRPFFDQIYDLLRESYLIALNATNCEGSDFVNGAYGTKNSYLCFGVFHSEECLYSYMMHHCTNCIDCIDLNKCELCYDCFSMRNSYECRSCRMCNNCVECLFCEDCIGCQNCIFSFGLRNQQYCIANKRVTKEEYERFIAGWELHKNTKVLEAKRNLTALMQRENYVTNTLINAEDSTGHFLTNVERVFNSFYTHDAHDCGHLLLSNNCSDFWRGFAESAELGYQSGSYFKAYCTYNCYMDVGGTFNLYSLFMYNACEHCFGSVGLNKKSYCILNKPYSKEEYFELVPRIIAHMKSTQEWGRFFPPHISPHYYQDAFCDEWISPISLTDAAQRGYRVRVQEEVHTAQHLSSSTIADSIHAIDSTILDKTFSCTLTNRPFKFQKKEIDFYQRFSIPLPLIHWRERIKKRIGEVYLIPHGE